MELTYATIAVLASMIFVLAGMVGYLYWQQTHMLQHLQSLAMALATHVEQVRQLQYQPEPEPELRQEPQPEKEEEDDRVSVEHVEGPPVKESTPTATSAVEDSVDDFQDKTASELRDMLTKKGIPFGKRDSKAVLIQLLLATS